MRCSCTEKQQRLQALRAQLQQEKAALASEEAAVHQKAAFFRAKKLEEAADHERMLEKLNALRD